MTLLKVIDFEVDDGNGMTDWRMRNEMIENELVRGVIE